jgi:hypothetical protein
MAENPSYKVLLPESLINLRAGMDSWENVIDRAIEAHYTVGVGLTTNSVGADKRISFNMDVQAKMIVNHLAEEYGLKDAEVIKILLLATSVDDILQGVLFL